MRVIDVTKCGADNTGQHDASAGFYSALEHVRYWGTGKLYAPAGRYVFSGSDRFYIDTKGIEALDFCGDGIGHTVFQLAPWISQADMEAGPSLIQVQGWNNPNGRTPNVRVFGFTIDGQRFRQNHAVPLTAGINAFAIDGGSIHDVEVVRWHAPVTPGQEAVCVHIVDSKAASMRDIITRDSPEAQGARISSQVIGSAEGGRIKNVFSEGCMSAAVLWQVIGGSIIESESHYSTYYGFDLEDCRGCYLGAGIISRHSALAGARFAESSNCTGEGIISSNNGGAGILVNGSNAPGFGGGSMGTLLRGNHCFDDQPVPTQTYGVEEDEDADYSYISGNRLVRNAIGAKKIVGPNSTYMPYPANMEG